MFGEGFSLGAIERIKKIGGGGGDYRAPGAQIKGSDSVSGVFWINRRRRRLVVVVVVVVVEAKKEKKGN